MSIYEVPLSTSPQKLQVVMGGIQYQLVLIWRTGSGWVMDIATPQGNAILSGVPLVTGIDLLSQYAYLGLGGSLVVATDADPDAVPTADNLGQSSHLYFVTS